MGGRDFGRDAPGLRQAHITRWIVHAALRHGQTATTGAGLGVHAFEGTLLRRGGQLIQIHARNLGSECRIREQDREHAQRRRKILDDDLGAQLVEIELAHEVLRQRFWAVEKEAAAVLCRGFRDDAIGDDLALRGQQGGIAGLPILEHGDQFGRGNGFQKHKLEFRMPTCGAFAHGVDTRACKGR